MITIYTLAYNEELLIEFMINHYRERFPNCRIVVYDNLSTDKTVKIALKNNCEVISYDTNNLLVDSKFLEIKNNCWKSALTDWVIVCDTDELLNINSQQLVIEEQSGTTIVKTKTYDMINMEDNLDIEAMKFGVPSPLEGKLCLFNKKYIQEINYSVGAHSCSPIGKVTYSKEFYNIYHYNSINIEATIKKFQGRASRLSPENLKNGWGFHYKMTPDQIRQEYEEERTKTVKVRD